MTRQIGSTARGRVRYVVAIGILSAMLAGCSSSGSAPTVGQAQTDAPVPVSTTQTQRPTQVVSSVRLHELTAPLDIAVPVTQGELTPVSKEGYEGWYATATTQAELVKGVLADWQQHLAGQGYEVTVGSSRLDARLKGTDARAEIQIPGTPQREASEQPNQNGRATVLATPEVPPTDTHWVQVRVLSSTGSEHTGNPEIVYIIVAYLARA